MKHMTMEEKKNVVCPNCGRHCPIDEVRCPRGEAFAAELRGGFEPSVGDEEGRGPRGEHGFHCERGPRRDHGPHGGRGPHGFGPMPFEDDDSLTALLLRCAHALRHPDGRGGSQGRVLRILSRWDGLSQRALQERLGVQPGSLSELVTKLEAKGLLTREQDGEDKRRVLLRLTEAGREAVNATPSPEERDARFAVLTQEERDALRALLGKLLERGGEEGAR